MKMMVIPSFAHPRTFQMAIQFLLVTLEFNGHDDHHNQAVSQTKQLWADICAPFKTLSLGGV